MRTGTMTGGPFAPVVPFAVLQPKPVQTLAGSSATREAAFASCGGTRTQASPATARERGRR